MSEITNDFLKERVNDMIEGYLNHKLITLPEWDRNSLQLTRQIMSDFRDFLETKHGE